MNKSLTLAATALIAAGTVFMMAMAFGVMSHRMALFLGTACYVVGGLLWGKTHEAPHAPAPGERPRFTPTVSPRDER